MNAYDSDDDRRRPSGVVKEPSKSTILIIDWGLFGVSWSQKLVPHFDRVLLHVPWTGPFPTSNRYLIGDGIEGVEKVDDIWPFLDEVDVFMFPDIYFGGLQTHLRELGKAVWGAGMAEELELFRYEAKQVFKDSGLPTKPYARLTGVDALRDYLKDKTNVFIKHSLVRGDVESFHHVNAELSEPLLDDLEKRLGARKFTKEFLVEEPIEGVELGYDGYTIDGQFPKTAMFAQEQKDVGMIAAIRPYDELPEGIKTVNEALTDHFREYQYRGFFSSEVRDDNGKPYLLDPCCRAASPGNEIYQEIYSNWPQIIVAGAHGELIDPEPVAKFGVEALIHSGWSRDQWQSLQFPDKIASKVKLRNACRVKDTWYIAPQPEGVIEIGAIVAVGETIMDAVKELKEIADQVQGYQLDIKMESLEKAVAALEESGEFKPNELPERGEVSEAINE